MKKVHITMIHDIFCSWCPIGYNNIRAAMAGVTIDFLKRQYYYNTYKGHLLIHWSERFNQQTELNEELMNAYCEH